MDFHDLKVFNIFNSYFKALKSDQLKTIYYLMYLLNQSYHNTFLLF